MVLYLTLVSAEAKLTRHDTLSNTGLSRDTHTQNFFIPTVPTTEFVTGAKVGPGNGASKRFGSHWGRESQLYRTFHQ